MILRTVNRNVLIAQESERNIDSEAPMVALTFDDGPSDITTPILLHELRENNAVATFFVLGINAEKHGDILNSILEGGNEIGNHSYDHEDLSSLATEDLRYQIDTTQEIIKEATGYTPKIMRPTYGFLSESLEENVGMPIIIWSIDTFDWANRNSETIINNILDHVQDGDIILMHDIYDSTIVAATTVIPELINRGFQLVTVSELSEYRGVPLLPGEIYRSFYPNSN